MYHLWLQNETELDAAEHSQNRIILFYDDITKCRDKMKLTFITEKSPWCWNSETYIIWRTIMINV